MISYDIFWKYNFNFLYNQYLINDCPSKNLSIMLMEKETIRLTLSSSDHYRYIWNVTPPLQLRLSLVLASVKTSQDRSKKLTMVKPDRYRYCYRIHYLSITFPTFFFIPTVTFTVTCTFNLNFNFTITFTITFDLYLYLYLNLNFYFYLCLCRHRYRYRYLNINFIITVIVFENENKEWFSL